ncbi:hypothetical protein DYB30_002484, partial [Aphanomyces astaci]
MHLTGDIHAVSAATNLLAAAIDARMFHERNLTDTTLYQRLVSSKAPSSSAQFTPAMRRRLAKLVASELMAILALANDLPDLKYRIGRMVVGFSHADDPVTVDDIGVTGALTALLRDAIEPTLMQTLEGTPAGFGADMGIEKFCNIKCRASGLAPDCIVLVATIRALKLHGGAASVVAGKQLPLEYTTERLDLVEMGSLNLAKQIANARAFHVPVVVAVSPFSHDSAAELELARTLAIAAGASDAVIAPYYAQGGAGAVDLAIAVQRAMQRRPDSGDRSELATLYTNDMCVVDKANAVATTMYGASAVEFEDSANADLI